MGAGGGRCSRGVGPRQDAMQADECKMSAHAKSFMHAQPSARVYEVCSMQKCAESAHAVRVSTIIRRGNLPAVTH